MSQGGQACVIGDLVGGSPVSVEQHELLVAVRAEHVERLEERVARLCEQARMPLEDHVRSVVAQGAGGTGEDSKLVSQYVAAVAGK